MLFQKQLLSLLQRIQWSSESQQFDICCIAMHFMILFCPIILAGVVKGLDTSWFAFRANRVITDIYRPALPDCLPFNVGHAPRSDLMLLSVIC